jgi:nitroreductase
MYPPALTEPYRTNRFAIGEQMYATIGIERADREGRVRQFARNADFFDAPAALFCFVDRQMGPPQWSDLGMFLQTLMLLAVERGLGTCPQEYWSLRHGAVRTFVQAPDHEMLFCGMSIGHPDPDAPINTLESERMPFAEWARFV